MRKRPPAKRVHSSIWCAGFLLASICAVVQVTIFQFPSETSQHEPNQGKFHAVLPQNSSDVHSQDAHRSRINMADDLIQGERDGTSERGPNPATTNASSRDPEARATDGLISNLYIFYYAWYGSPAVDGRWLHWDHKVPALRS